eukprot:412067-Pelagomonas_calceolata.AAC.1
MDCAAFVGFMPCLQCHLLALLALPTIFCDAPVFVCVCAVQPPWASCPAWYFHSLSCMPREQPLAATSRALRCWQRCS